MILCDIGNTHFFFFEESRGSYKEKADTFEISSISEKVYFISVNHYWEKRLEHEENWINLRNYVDFSAFYESMGIDRIACCMAAENALIIDAGSAITVDKMEQAQHRGGYIYPGFAAFEKCYRSISPRLELSFNFDIDLAIMPKNTRDALSFGALAPLVCSIRELSQDSSVIITGGDAERLHPFVPHALIDHELVFKGIKKIIEGIA